MPKYWKNSIKLVGCISMFFLFSPSASFATGMTCADLFSSHPQARIYSAEVMEKKLFAIHATDVLPENGVLVAGSRNIDTGTFKNSDFRLSVHFSLGELVRPHDGFSWENRRLAVVIPLESIVEHISNLNAYDTYSLGDVVVPPQAIYVVTQDDIGKLRPGSKYFEYDPKVMSLRKAIDQVIADRGGWSIRTFKNLRMVTPVKIMGAKASFDGENINNLEFFQPLIKKYPWISFGDHGYSQHGTAYRLAGLNQVLRKLRLAVAGREKLTTDSRELLLELFDDHLFHLKKEVSRFPNALAIANKITEAEQKETALINTIKLDLKFRQDYGFTITNLPPDVREKAAKLTTHDVLWKYLREQAALGRLEPVEAETNLQTVNEVLPYLFALDKAEFFSFLRSHWSVFGPPNYHLVMATYAIDRILTLRAGSEESHELFKMLDDALTKMPELQKPMFAKRYLLSFLEENLDMRLDRIDDALAIVNQPKVRELLSQQFGFQLPKKTTLSLQDFVKSDPATEKVSEKNFTSYKAALLASKKLPSAK